MNKVMIVDDDVSIRYTVSVVLDGPHIEVIQANGGNECLSYLSQGFRGLILLDVMMPDMDGWETVRQIVAHGYDEQVVICMLTAKLVPDSEMDPIKSFVVDYVTKPFKSDELIQRVQEYLGYIPDIAKAA